MEEVMAFGLPFPNIQYQNLLGWKMFSKTNIAQICDRIDSKWVCAVHTVRGCTLLQYCIFIHTSCSVVVCYLSVLSRRCNEYTMQFF